MPHLKVAHINEQGQNMIIFPLDSEFGAKTDADRADLLEELEERAHAAGLAGRAVAVWERGNSTHFIGPHPWHSFLQSISLRWVLMNVNKQLSWYRRRAREDRDENAGSGQGRQLLLDRHLASTTSGFNDPRLIRIYYVYGKICAKIVIGSLPGHLPTSRS